MLQGQSLALSLMNGTVILNAVTATNDGTGVYYVDLGISNTTDVNKLYAVWTGTWESISQKLRTNHEILGFPIFTEAQARSFDVSQLLLLIIQMQIS